MEENKNIEANDPPSPEHSLPPEHRLSIIDLIYGLLFSPTATFQKISAQPPLSHAFIIFTTVTLIGIMFTVLAPPVNPDLPSDMPPEMAQMVMAMMPYIGLIGAFFAFLIWFVLAGILQLFSEFLGGRGKALEVFTVLGLSELPNIFSGPIYFLTNYLGKSTLATFLTISSGLLIFIWRFILIVIGLREVHGYSTGRAVVTVLAPAIILILFIVVVVVALVGMMIPMFENLPK